VKNKRILAFMLVAVMTFASLPMITFASELQQDEDVVVFTEEDGITVAVDIDALLEELLASSKEQQCDELDLFIELVLDHQLRGESIYATVWHIDDLGLAQGRNFMGRFTSIQAVRTSSNNQIHVRWQITNVYWREIEITASAAMYNGNTRVNWLAPIHRRLQPSSRLDVLIMEHYPPWTRSVLELNEEGMRSQFSIFR